MIKKLEKADGQSMDIVENNIEQLKELFPEVFAEGRINFDRLQEVLGNYVVTDEDHYNFTWHGKRAAGRLAQTPSTGTLRPCPQESVDWDKTQNLFIEGDNLEVLKLLQKSYHRQIKMIYIDPPYNTGNDFVYEDDFKDGVKNYLAVTGQLDDEGKKKGTNSSAAGRYHTNWLNMMYPRLKLARNLLRDDGVIFISIDDNEQTNLKKLCDEIFGEDNFISQIIWKKTENIKMDSRFLSENKDYIICYRKRSTITEFEKEQSDIERFNLEDEKGKYYLRKLDSKSSAYRKTLDYVIEHEGEKYYAGGSYENWERRQKGEVGGFAPRWLWSEQKFKTGLKDGEIIFKNGNVYNKVRFDGIAKKPHVDIQTLVSGQTAQKELDELFGKRMFDHPKPPQLIEWLTTLLPNEPKAIVLDFFAGSSSTAHGIMRANTADGGTRRFIMIQLPEAIEDGHDAVRAGMNTIADISKERIRLAGKEIKQEYPLFGGDLGFKVFKLDTSNIKTWEAGFDTLKDDLIAAADYIKQDRSSDDIVFELLLKYGLDLTVPIETRMIAGKKVYSIGMGALVVCLDNDVPMETVGGIGALKEELKPEIMRVVFKDSGFKDDVVKTNALQTLKRFGIEDIKSL